MKVTPSWLTICEPIDCSPPGSSVHGILQPRILELVAIPFSRGPSQPLNTMEYYSAIIKNEIMSFVATWMDLGITIISKTSRERQISYDITYKWNLKNDINEPIYKTDTDSQMERTNLRLPKGKGGRGVKWGRSTRTYCIAQGTLVNTL